MGSGYDGIVVAGGGSKRMGGGDKTALTVHGRTMRAASLSALARADRLIVVGPGGDIVEDPPGSGPLAAVAAGLSGVTASIVVLLAADLPFVTVAAIEELVGAAPAVAVDDQGRMQYLLGAYGADELRAALPPSPANGSLRSVIGPLHPREVRLPGQPPPWWDCDTWDDLELARSWS